jgi:hypothetical protein
MISQKSTLTYPPFNQIAGQPIFVSGTKDTLQTAWSTAKTVAKSIPLNLLAVSMTILETVASFFVDFNHEGINYCSEES